MYVFRLSVAALATLSAWPLSPALAQTRGEAVVVTASRFPDPGSRAPANVSSISREEIAASPSLSIPDLLKSHAGIDIRPLYGPLGIDATVDIRGFGDSAGSNTLVLIDGIRLNPVDSGGVNWSALPLGAIERIEIIRGSGAVLYGDRAVGGVVNIITDKSGKPRANLEASLGSHDFRKLAASAQGGSGAFVYSAAASYAETDGWRDNSDADQRAANGRLGWFVTDNSEVFIDLAAYGDRLGQPGSIAEADFRRRPRFARTPDDRAKSEGYRIRPGFTQRFGPSLELAAEAGLDHQRSTFDSPQFGSVRDRDTLFMTPRLRWNHGLGELASESVVGFDWYHGEVESASESSFSGANLQTGKQISKALYVQNTTRLPAGVTLTAGLRRQEVDQQAGDRQASLRGRATRARTAHDLGISWQAAPTLRLFGRSGRVFRFANTDELFGFDPNTFASVFAGDLRPQHGTQNELGGEFRQGPLSVRAAVFRLDLKNEIGFNSETFANENFDRTRRSGVEIEADWQISEQFFARLALTRQRARYEEGEWAGNTIPLVPDHQASLSLGWQGGARGNYSAVLRDVGERRYTGDNANRLKRLAGYSTVDLQAEWTLQAWSVGLRVMNLFDQRYAPFALYSSFQDDFFHFPADPRTVFVSVRHDFR